jgi:sugar lactone lactonase YvrE
MPLADPALLRCVAPQRALLGEGPTWWASRQRLLWVDILGPSLHGWDPKHAAAHSQPLPRLASLALPCDDGRVLLATPAGLRLRAPAEHGEHGEEQLVHPAHGRAGTRYNDGRCDALGRLWIGSMDVDAVPGRGALHCVEAGRHRLVEDGFTIPNGIAWSPDHRHMYFVDSGRRTVFRYDYDLERGIASHRRVWIEVPASAGKPDGLCVSEDGSVWIAMWDGWHVARHAPDGRLLGRVLVPVPRPTSCTFGGEDLRTLFITSASVRMSAQSLLASPQSGGLFALPVRDTRGLAETPFALGSR